jgi:hypothetical protein
MRFFTIVALLLTAHNICAQEVVQDSITHTLPEVMIRGEHPIAKVEQGKIVFDMPHLLKSMPAENALEALTRLPGVTEREGTYSYGASPVTLIINGKTTTLTQEQVQQRLKAIPATELAKMEVMLAAPPKYHVRGAAINIVTRDYAGTHQLSGQLSAGIQGSKYALGIGRANMHWQSGKLGLDASWSMFGGKSYSEVGHEANHPLRG